MSKAKTKKKPAREIIMVKAQKMCRNRIEGLLCGSLWRHITVYPKSKRRVPGTPIKCYMCRTTDARVGKLDRLDDWK